MRWQAKPRPEWEWTLPLFFPIELDGGGRILWEWVQHRFTCTRENWAGFEGYTEYRDRFGNHLGRITHG